MTLRDLMTKIDGFYKVREYNEELVRRLAFFSTMPYHKANTSPSDLWVLPSEQYDKQLENEKEELEANKNFAKILGLKV